MVPPAPAVAAILAALALAGCLAPGAPGDGGPRALPGPAVATVLPAAPEPFRFLLCDGGLLPLDGDHAAGCNVQATHDSGPAAEVSLAVNPLDPRNLVGGSKDFSLGEDERCGRYSVWSGVYTSFDGGRTWAHQLLPGHPGDARQTALSRYACGSDPVVAFGPDGTAYYNSIHVTYDASQPAPPLPQLGPVVGQGFSNAGIAVTRSLDGGRTWEAPVVFAHRQDGGVFDKQWIAVDTASGALYVTAFDTLGGDFLVWRSDDRGLTWTEPMLIEPGMDGTTGRHQFMQVGVAPDGVVHVTYWCQVGARGSHVCHRASADRGATWGEATLVAPYYPVLDLELTHKYRVVPMPDLAVDPRDGALHVAYPFYADPSAGLPAGNMDILAASSRDGGRTWSAPVRINDELLAPANGQWMVALEAGPDGAVHATWLDYRDDPRGQFAHVYYAHSRDQGRTWSANGRVSDVATDGTGGYHQTGSGTIGDYMGLAVSERAVHPFWADTRHGRNDVFSAVIPAAVVAGAD